MIPPDPDEEARKKAANPLTSYFNSGKPADPSSATTPPTTPGYGAASNPTAQNANAAPKAAPVQQPSTNVGSGSNVGSNSTPRAPIAEPAAPAPQRTYQQPTIAGPTQAPTDFVNFQRYWNANQDASKASAAGITSRAEEAANEAAGKLATSQTDFNQQVAAGTVPGAPAVTDSPGAYQPGVAPSATNDAPVAPTAAPGPPPNRSGYQQITDPATLAADNEMTLAQWNAAGQPDAAGQPTQPVGGSNQSALSGDSTRPAAGLYGLSDAQLSANANGQYTGPGGLGDVASSQAAYDAAKRAQGLLGTTATTGGIQAQLDQNNPAGSNTSAFSSGLVGAAGSSQFDKLRATFNPQKDLDAATTADAAKAKAAGDTSATNAAGWGKAQSAQQAAQQMQSDANASDDAKAKALRDAAATAKDAQAPAKGYGQSYGQDTPQNRQAYMMSGVDQSDPTAVAKRQGEIAQYQAAMHLTDANQADRAFDDFNSVMSPISWAANASGNEDPIHAAGVKTYGNTGQAGQTGSTTGIPISWDRAGVDGFFVYRSMTPADFQMLSQKPTSGPNGQIAWIQQKAAQLRSQQPSQATAAGRSQST